MQEEKMIDIKGTFAQFIKTDEPELSQEEAIMKYQEPIQKRKNSSDDDDDASNTEEQEHLKRVKQELLASLKRVEKLEREIFKDKEDKMKVKVKGKDSNGGGVNQNKSIEDKEVEYIRPDNQKERE